MHRSRTPSLAWHGRQGTLSGSTIPAFRLLLPFPAYTAINEIFGENNYASYNSMIIKGNKRFSHGLTFLSTFTWSKNRMRAPAAWAAISTAVGPEPTLAGAPQNPYTFAGEYSYSNVDAPFRSATSISYELPFGKGQGVPGYHQPRCRLIIGGWVINTVSIFQTGFPLQIYPNNANSAYGYGVQRPNMTSTSPGTSGSLEQRLYNYINPAAFTKAPAATFGNTPRTSGEFTRSHPGELGRFHL